MANVEIPAHGFVEAYNKWQIVYAAARIQGWNGSAADAAPELSQAYDEMLEAFEALHIAVHGRGRPNYASVARAMLERAPKG